MYEEYFSFAASPFRLNPDPKFFFGSRSHNKAMAYLHYGLRQGEGFIVITGEIGAGKSILIGHLVDQLDRSSVVAAHLLTANLEPAALLPHVLSAFRIEAAGSGKSAEIEAFEDFLFDQMNRGRRVLLIVDEAQNLPVATIEELRMLSNMDYDGTPLFQVFLVGQPEFRTVLAKPEMEQFRQRIIASYHLEPLGAEESADYIRHRLTLVGWNDNPAISDDAFDGIFRATGGVPRKINKLCNRLFLYCSLEKLNAIDGAVVGAVVADLKAENLESDAEDEAGEAAPAPKAKLKKAKKREPEAREAVGERKRAVGEEVRSHAPLPKPVHSPVVIPFDSARKAGGQAPSPPRAVEAAAEAVETSAPAALAQRESAATASETKRNQSTDDSMSVLDRLRKQRAPASESEPAPEPATLKDVAQAIAAAAASGAGADSRLETAVEDEFFDAPTAAAPSENVEPSALSEGDPPSVDDPRDWRGSALKTIDETREDLKSAHAGVGRLSRQLAELEKRRREKGARVAAGLARAENLLANLRDNGQ